MQEVGSTWYDVTAICAKRKNVGGLFRLLGGLVAHIRSMVPSLGRRVPTRLVQVNGGTGHAYPILERDWYATPSLSPVWLCDRICWLVEFPMMEVGFVVPVPRIRSILRPSLTGKNSSDIYCPSQGRPYP